MPAFVLFYLEVRPGGLEGRLVFLRVAQRGGGSERNRLVLNIRTASGNTRGVTALGMALMNSITSVSAARLISFDYRHTVDYTRDGIVIECTS